MIVRTQKDLDVALAAGEALIEIRSEPGVWLRVGDTKSSSSVEAWGSSRVEARESSSVEAWESSSVVAWESSSVEARGSSSVVAWESSSVVAWGSSSVEARESSSVVARESSSVVAWGSSSVVAWGSSSVVAWGSSSVVAWGSSSVVAWESSSVVAWESSSVEATPHVAVHLHSANVTVKGGVVIDVTGVDKTAANWIEHHGIEVRDGKAVLYKAVRDDLRSSHGMPYPLGETVTTPDWRDDQSCGGGLHLSPHPRMARDYDDSATRYLQVLVDAERLRPIPGGYYDSPKCKVQSCVVVAEVTIDGEPVEAEAVAS